MNIAKQVDQAHENKKEGVRYHYSISKIGEKCERKSWMDFRWCKTEKFSGRMKRLFRRGHREELLIVEDLKAIGIKVENYGEEQMKVVIGCHISSDIDGVLTIDNEKILLEGKTFNKKTFDKLLKEGVQKSKPMHYDQMQVYMFGTGVHKTLYYAVCKDNDDLYCKFITLDVERAEFLIDRAKRIATQDELPMKMTDNPSWYECKFCNYHGFCHKGEKIENKNCRTCAYSTSMDDGTWYCELLFGDIDEATQPHGCDRYEKHDHLVT